jgi:hypothetical protein
MQTLTITTTVSRRPTPQFACVFRLIHDVDHEGVPNAVPEKTDTAFYEGKSIAERTRPGRCSWVTTMAISNAIYSESEGTLPPALVNSVMATDIMDKDLK